MGGVRGPDRRALVAAARPALIGLVTTTPVDLGGQLSNPSEILETIADQGWSGPARPPETAVVAGDFDTHARTLAREFRRAGVPIRPRHGSWSWEAQTHPPLRASQRRCPLPAAAVATKDGWLAAPGVVHPDVVGSHGPTTTPHIRWSDPFNGPSSARPRSGGSAASTGSSPTPANLRRSSSTRRNGYHAFERLFTAHDAEYFDQQRLSVV